MTDNTTATTAALSDTPTRKPSRWSRAANKVKALRQLGAKATTTITISKNAGRALQKAVQGNTEFDWNTSSLSSSDGNNSSSDSNRYVITLPLLSVSNCYAVKNLLAYYLFSSIRIFFTSRKSILGTIVAFLAVILAGLTLQSLIIVGTTYTVLHMGIWGTVYILHILFDLNSIQQRLIPTRCWTAFAYVVGAYAWLDYYILQGFRYSYRHIDDPQDFPDCLVSKYTQQHASAIQYCSSMMQQEHMIQQQLDYDLSRPLSPITSLDEDSGVSDRAKQRFRDRRRKDERRIENSGINNEQKNGGRISDMPWIDVGAKIGMRLLHSSHVQRVLTAEDAMNQYSNATGIGETGSTVTTTVTSTVASTMVKRPLRPIHSMWASAAVATDDVNTSGLSSPPLSDGSRSDLEEEDYRDDGEFETFFHTSAIGSPTNNSSNGYAATSPTANDSSSGKKLVRRKSKRKHRGMRKILASRLQRFSISPKHRQEITQALPDGQIEIAPPSPLKLPLLIENGTAPVSQTVPVHSEIETVLEEHSRYHRRQPLASGTKVFVPLFPYIPRKGKKKRRNAKMAMANHMSSTVIASERIYVGNRVPGLCETNCISITVVLDKAYLRNGRFAKLTLRVMDSWSDRYMPKHSKVPIGSCVATSFGVGVLVGWRVQDDCYVIRSLWHRRGAGAAYAYMNGDAIHGTIPAIPGFRVETKYGRGVALAYIDGGKKFLDGSYIVAIKDDGRKKGHVLKIHNSEMLSCHGAQFIPIIEHIREAAHFQIQVDNYNAELREQELPTDDTLTSLPDQRVWDSWSQCLELLWNSFIRVVEEDKDFDRGANDFMSRIIQFLEKLDAHTGKDVNKSTTTDRRSITTTKKGGDEKDVYNDKSISDDAGDTAEPGGVWIIDDLLGGLFNQTVESTTTTVAAQKAADYKTLSSDSESLESNDNDISDSYERAFVFLNTLMKTVALTRAASVDYHHFRLSLAIMYDFLLFLRTIVKVQQKNLSKRSLQVWKRAIEEISSTFGPLRDRLAKIGHGIATRMEKHGREAKVRIFSFADILLSDERLIFSVEQGEWDICYKRIELALIRSDIIKEENIVYYRKTAKFIYEHFRTVLSNESGAAARNTEKLAILEHIVKCAAAPRRSILKLFRRNDVLELFERILVRVFYKEMTASRMLTIHASNFQSLRHLRILKDLSISGSLWLPLLDAADEEFSYIISNMPEQTKTIVCPLASLFSLCVSQIHKIVAGDTSIDWLDFLLEDDAVRIIHEIDMKLILALESFSHDIKEVMMVLPYYASIDDDILNLMDEVNLDMFLKEASQAIDDPDSLTMFLREKATIAIERFLNYLPKMSIPVEKRELGDGWVLSCHGEDGGDLTLSDVSVNRENLSCQIMGGDSLFFPKFGEDNKGQSIDAAGQYISPTLSPEFQEESILDHIREMIEQAQRHGCWKSGVGGVGLPSTDRYIASKLPNIPLSAVLSCGIDLWRNLEIDDDELLEIAIRDVSYQIQLQKVREEGDDSDEYMTNAAAVTSLDYTDSAPSAQTPDRKGESFSSFDVVRRRFNPRVDPTVLHLEMNKLTLNLENFLFRIEKGEKKTIFDPVFDGRGMVSIENLSISLRVECAKEKSSDSFVPILLLKELHVDLDKVRLQVKETGFGSDWLVNKAVGVFSDNITNIVHTNLQQQVNDQVKNAISNLNAYFAVNPNMMLSILSISIDDLDEHIVWV